MNQLQLFFEAIWDSSSSLCHHVLYSPPTFSILFFRSYSSITGCLLSHSTPAPAVLHLWTDGGIRPAVHHNSSCLGSFWASHRRYTRQTCCHTWLKWALYLVSQTHKRHTAEHRWVEKQEDSSTRSRGSTFRCLEISKTLENDRLCSGFKGYRRGKSSSCSFGNKTTRSVKLIFGKGTCRGVEWNISLLPHPILRVFEHVGHTASVLLEPSQQLSEADRQKHKSETVNG